MELFLKHGSHINYYNITKQQQINIVKRNRTPLVNKYMITTVKLYTHCVNLYLFRIHKIAESIITQ